VRCRKKWASLAIGRTNAGFEYWALEASDQVTRAFARQSATVPGHVELFLAGASGGVSAAIVAIVDAYVQPRVPLTTSCVTASAKTVTVALAGTVYVHSGLRTQAQAAAEAALAEYIAAVPIGGEKVGSSGVVSREVLAACIARGSPANRVDGVVDLALTTPATDVALGATEVPILDVSNLTWTEV
jgi:phage-related baseplate assembly protein